MNVTVNLKLLRALRETHKMSISDMADYLGYKTPTSIWLIERGERNVSIEALYKIARKFNVNMEDLLIVS